MLKAPGASGHNTNRRERNERNDPDDIHGWEDQMYEQDMQERYIYFPGVMVYDKDRNEEISEKEMEMQMNMQLCYLS